MNEIVKFIKTNRKAAGLTQKEFALRSGLGLRFVRDLEQGKETVRMDKVNQALALPAVWRKLFTGSLNSSKLNAASAFLMI